MNKFQVKSDNTAKVLKIIFLNSVVTIFISYIHFNGSWAGIPVTQFSYQP